MRLPLAEGGKLFRIRRSLRIGLSLFLSADHDRRLVLFLRLRQVILGALRAGILSPLAPIYLLAADEVALGHLVLVGRFTWLQVRENGVLQPREAFDRREPFRFVGVFGHLLEMLFAGFLAVDLVSNLGHV